MMTTPEIQNIKARYGIIGNDPMLNHAIEQATQIARTQLSVIITGENGVGKDVFSRLIHDFSSCKHGPFFSVNCGAIPEGTIESELFGHAKGAFTDAKGDHKGYFEVANGGTLFLDEVGELPLSAQVRLLRVLENGEFRRVGDSAILKTKVRVVAATNRDLPKAIVEGRFRQDLYYRLNGFEIHIPPLRERREDIPLLFRKFSADFAELNVLQRISLSEDAKQLLMSYYWAGNIRQLRNVADHVCLMEAGREVDAHLLRPYLPDNELNRAPAIIGHRASSDTSGGMSDSEKDQLYRLLDAVRKDLADLHAQVEELKKGHAEVATPVIHTDTSIASTPIRPASHQINKEEFETVEEYHEEEEQSASLEDIERQTIKAALERNRNSRKMTAIELKISERTLYRKIKEYEL